MHHSPPIQHHPGDLYSTSVNMVGAYLGGYQGGSAGSESPGSPLTPLTPLTPTTPNHLQAQFCHQTG